mmetsp:Transcript_29503/g.26084  ORF Transcript_29503/g.26084 Transcript_29503/m.26084 type:complete len:128 (+) Transcript_29503:225-608(+)|eukprot:CAMPEP_0205804694 /NCGR_PEP_ID=MMETSP0205-20121125/7688_1 /ASSEMBLY_ACC=CAM_ASM_000278 /TAXON_ID=36767 /ORGANISM="Euplotes focardii, Strain TN1" /LENGTH=127 /DNA_ID=CAMNT_0053074709 /DNA_START=172 /DNA_END=555 /DNA_ORIENTATION=-
MSNFRGLKPSNRLAKIEEGKSSAQIPDISTPDAQSVLLSYVQKNPHNHKVISFLKKHYDIGYNFEIKQWEASDNPRVIDPTHLDNESLSTAISSMIGKSFKNSLNSNPLEQAQDGIEKSTSKKIDEI